MNFKRTCRTCLYESCHLIPIHDIKLIQGNNSTTVPALIEFCFKLKVLLDDGLPQNICVKCADALKCVYDFQVQCYKSAHKIGIQTGNKNVLASLEYVLTDTINLPFNTKHAFDNNNATKHLGRESSEVHKIFSYEHNYAIQPKISKFCSARPLFYQIVRKANPSTCLTYNGYAMDAEDDSEAESDLDYGELTAKFKASRHTQTDSADTYKMDKKTAKITQCPACDFQQTDRKVLAKHIMDAHTRDRDCQICNSKGIRFLQAHCERHLPEKYFCTECNKGFLRKAQFSCHKKFAGEKLLECDTCSERFCLEKDYDWHMKRHELQETSPGQILECCGREFLSEIEFNTHRHKSHATQNYECPTCSQVSDSRQEYIKHMATHKPEKKPRVLISCTVCKKRLESTDRLEHHTRKVHPEIIDENELELRRCHICFYVCKSKNLLYRHSSCHEEIQMYGCKLCDRSYSRRKHLQCHVESFHSNLRRYKCDLCNKDFKYRANLSTHQSSKMHKENLKAKSMES